MIFNLLFTLLTVGLLGVLAIGLLSPIESLGWWAGNSAERVSLEYVSPSSGSHRVLVYLSGIGSISGDELMEEEALLLDRMQALLPDTTIVRDVFPYSVQGVSLTGARAFAGLWRWLGRTRLSGARLLSSLINLRNLFQVAVAADPRYGPLFSYGVARVIATRAIEAGFQPRGTQPLTLLGYSGGAQVAVGATPFLRQMLGSEIHVISLGGVLNSDPGLTVLSRMDHLVGERDLVERIGGIIYPGRWPISQASAWNKARHAGIIRIEQMAGMAHNSPGGYMDPNAHGVTGELNPDITARTIASVL